MAIELQQNLRLQQQLVMTPQLQMAIKLLQLSKLELVEMIQQEIETNPTLEDSHIISAEEDKDKTDKEPLNTKEVTIDEKFDNYLDWHNYLDEFNSTGKIHFESEKKDATDLEAFTTNKTSLADHLRWQLLMKQPSPEDEEIGSHIIGNINKNGYLDISVEDIAENSHYSTDKIHQILSLVQSFDPPGIGAADLKECLLLQTKYLAVENPLINDIIRFHIKNLEADIK